MHESFRSQQPSGPGTASVVGTFLSRPLPPRLSFPSRTVGTELWGLSEPTASDTFRKMTGQGIWQTERITAGARLAALITYLQLSVQPMRIHTCVDQCSAAMIHREARSCYI